MGQRSMARWASAGNHNPRSSGEYGPSYVTPNHTGTRMKTKQDSSTAWLIALLLLAILSARVIHFYMSPDASLIGVVPDDAFYYLKLAQNYAALGRWTFDGTAPTTGFHMLYAYGLVAIYKVAPAATWREVYLLVSALASLSMAAAIGLTWSAVRSWWTRAPSLVAIAPFFSVASLVQSTSMMESWLVILLAALMFYQVSRTVPLTRLSTAALLATAALGSMARSDFGLLAGCLCVMGWLGHKVVPLPTRQRLSWALAGAVLGVVVVVLHTHHISGHFSQASAQVKLHWSAVIGHSWLPPLLVVFPLTVPFAADIGSMTKNLDPNTARWMYHWFAWMALAAAISTAIAVAWHWRSMRAIDRRALVKPGLFVWLGCVATCFGYMVFYKHNSAALQTWYAANLLIPVGVSLGGIYQLLLQDTRRWLSFALAGAFATSGLLQLNKVTWPHQAGMLQAGLYLKTQPKSIAYGGWNAGVISYFSEQTYINLDGLTNDDAVPFIKDNTLLDYVKQRNIRYIVDYANMLRSKGMRVRGGYDDPRLEWCVTPVRRLDDGKATWTNSVLSMYAITPNCL